MFANQITKRSFAQRVPMIKFIGKRQKFNKHLGVFQTGAADTQATNSSSGEKKAVSPKSDLVFADAPAERWSRLAITDEEMEIINQGTNEIDAAEWANIKL